MLTVLTQTPLQLQLECVCPSARARRSQAADGADGADANARKEQSIQVYHFEFYSILPKTITVFVAFFTCVVFKMTLQD
jgi:hypothetical protein